MKNVYDTTDPQKLLELKRLETASLLDVLRTINHTEVDISKLCLIARNVLRAQLGVKRVIFFYEFEGRWVEGIRLAFDEMSLDAIEELIQFTKTTRVTAGFAPSLFEMEAEFVVPIINRGEPSAYFVVADFAVSEMEEQNDLIFIATLGNILNVAIRNRQLIKERIQQEYIRKELEVAETIQKQLLISDFSKFKEIDVFGLNIPHHKIGGDFYDVIKKGKGTTFVAIGDVAGKGIAAALLMSNLMANLRALCAQHTDIVLIVRELNKIIFNITQGERFVTFFLARIDQDEKQFAYVNAGHNYPILVQKNGYKELSEGCMLLGIMPEIGISTETIDVTAQDNLFMFTDGIVEQEDPKEEMFGTDRIIQTLMEAADKSSKEIVNHFEHALLSYADDTPVVDDITMLNIKFLG